MIRSGLDNTITLLPGSSSGSGGAPPCWYN